MNQLKEIIKVGQVELRFLLDGNDTNDQMVVFESFFPGGSKVSVPPHYHLHMDEMIYGLDGILTVTLDGKEIEIAPGRSCFIPRNTIHHLRNNTGQTVRSLGVITPALVGPSYFREISKLFEPGAVPDPAKVKEIMLRNDTVPVAL